MINIYKCRIRQIGLTLVELLIVLVVMSIIMGGLVTAFISHSRISAAEEARMEVQQNLRVSVDRLKHVLRHAGFGSYTTFQEFDAESIDNAMYGDDPNNGSIGVSSFISHIDNQDTSEVDINSDSFIFTYGFKKIAEVDIDGSEDLDNNQIKLKNIDTPSITSGSEYKRYLSFFPAVTGNRFFEVDSLDGSEVTFTQEIGFDPEQYSDNIDVYMVSPSRVFLDDDLRIYNQIFSYQSIPVQFNPAQYWIIAENIEDIQFQYFIPDQGWMGKPVDDDLQDIRKIRFWLLGRSKKSVPGAGQQDLEVVVDKDSLADDDICIDNVDSNKCVVYRVPSVDEEGRIRMLSRGEVTLRNVF